MPPETAPDDDESALLSRIDDLRIASIRPLMPAACLIEELADASVVETIRGARGALSAITRGTDQRLAVVIGPAAAHDPAAVLEFARRLVPVQQRLGGELLLVVRVFLDEPGGGAGRWSGAMYDPGLDGSFQLNRGFRQARQLLVDIARLGLPAGCLYLDSISPQFIADLVSWSAVGASTAASALHRELASGLSTPVGFHATAASADAAVGAVRAASAPHAFLSVSKQGVAGIVQTTGNRDGHLVLPAASAAEAAEAACGALAALGLPARAMVDCGYGAGCTTPQEQAAAAAAVAARVADGDGRVCGVVLSAFLKPGRQEIGAQPSQLQFGLSVTEPCLGWEDALATLEALAAAVAARRRASPPPVGRSESMPRAPFRELGAIEQTDNLRVQTIRPLLSPACAIEEVELPLQSKRLVLRARCDISAVVQGDSDRLLVLAGPPAVHDPSEAMEYAARLAALAAELESELLVVMAVNLSRSSSAADDAAAAAPGGPGGGWAGLVTDPRLDGSVDMNSGFRAARRLLLDIAQLGLPTAVEYVDTITPQFVADLASYALVGSRQAGSRAHRELASGLSTPVGFQGGASSADAAVDAVRSAASGHAFLSVSKQGVAGIVQTTGNRDCHLVLPAASAAEAEEAACGALAALGLPARAMVDCGYGAGCTTPQEQAAAAAAVAARVAGGDGRVCGAVLPSYLLQGRQPLAPGGKLTRGMSVAGACLDWGTTEAILREFAVAVTARRAAAPEPPSKKARSS